MRDEPLPVDSLLFLGSGTGPQTRSRKGAARNLATRAVPQRKSYFERGPIILPFSGGVVVWGEKKAGTDSMRNLDWSDQRGFRQENGRLRIR